MASERSGFIEPGTWVDHFRVKRLVGRGGMGEVYQARDTRLGRKVALKVIHQRLVSRPTTLRRFLFEARATARFSHPNIVTIYATGQWEGSPYLALEFLDGQTLRQRLAEGPLPVAEAARLGQAMAEALAEAHAHEVLHRDLKPENVALPPDGRPRVLDFGLAKALSSAAGTNAGSAVPQRPVPLDGDLQWGGSVRLQQTLSLQESALDATAQAVSVDLPRLGTTGSADTVSQELFVTAGGKVRGTPAYMAPEIWLQHTVTQAVDLWSLGVVLYEMVAGRRPFRGQDPVQLAIQVNASDREPDWSVMREAPDEFVEIVQACLSRTPAKRPSAAHVAEVLGNVRFRFRRHTASRRSPYRGLLPFDERHAELFFGRDSEVDLLQERLREAPFLPVVGPSGAGKSSLIAAGLVPRLRAAGRWEVLRMRPGARPFARLAQRIARYLSREETSDEQVSIGDSFAGVEALGRDAQTGGSLEALLEQDLREIPGRLGVLLRQVAESTGAHVLLFVDQLEEAFTLVPDAAVGQRFLEAICAAADDPDDPVRVVVAIRDDFLGRAAVGPVAQEAFSRVAVLRRPEPSALAAMVIEPLERVGYRLEDPEQVEAMVATVAKEPACLPLLQFTCQAVWERRDEGQRRIPADAYAAVGGVAGALVRHADGVLEGMSAEQMDLARQILLQLVTPERTRRTATLAELEARFGQACTGVLNRLVGERLLTLHRARTAGTGGARVELVHESLIHRWSRLSRWLDASREEHRILEQVSQAASLWEERGRPDEEVWSGRGLEDALRAAARSRVPLPELVQTFLREGEARQHRALRRRRVMRTAAFAGLLGLLAAALLVAWIVNRRSREAIRERDRARRAQFQAEMRRAEAECEAARAALLRDDIDEALGRARVSLELVDRVETRALLWRLWRRALVYSIRLRSTASGGSFLGRTGRLAVATTAGRVVLLDATGRRVSDAARGLRGVLSLANASETGPRGGLQRLLVSNRAGELALWDVEAGRVIARAHGHQGPIWTVDASPGGHLAVSGGQDGAVRLWQLPDLVPLRRFTGNQGPVLSVRLGPRARRIASVGRDGMLRIWSVDRQRPVAAVSVGGAADGLAFSPNGAFVMVGRLDGRLVRVALVPEVRVSATYLANAQRLNDVALDGQGRFVATAGADGTVRVLDGRDGRLLAVFHSRQHRPLWWVRFSASGARLVAGGSGGEVASWRFRPAWHTSALPAHARAVLGAALGPEERSVVTAARDGTVGLWDLASGVRLRRILVAARDVRVVERVGAAGRFLVGCGGEGPLRLVDVLSGRVERLMGGRMGTTYSVAVLPQGRRALSASGDGVLRLWDLETGGVVRRWPLGLGPLSAVAASRRARWAVVGAKSGVVVCIDLETGQPLGTMKVPSVLMGLAVDPMDRRLVAATLDGEVRAYGVPPAGLHRAGDVAAHRRGAVRASVHGKGPNRPLRLQWRRSLSSKANRVRFSPDGRLVAVGLDAGAAVLDAASGRLQVRLSEYRGEVNDARFFGNGQVLVTAGEDGTVRTWTSRNGRPLWRLVGLLSGPWRLVSHEGIARMDGPGTVRRPRTALERHLVRSGLHVSGAPGASDVCLATWDGQVERWRGQPRRRVWRRAVPGVRQVAVLGPGCLALGRDELLWVKPGGTKRLVRGASALYVDGRGILVGTRDKVVALDRQGRQRWTRQAGDTQVTALFRRDGEVMFGTANGAVVRLGTETEAGRRAAPAGAPSTWGRLLVVGSAVTALGQGAPGTLLVGTRSGEVGLYGLGRRQRLERLRLHGPVALLRVLGSSLLAASELGDWRRVDGTVFKLSWCELLRRVWRRVPRLWQGGRLVRAPAPRGHPCFRPGDGVLP